MTSLMRMLDTHKPTQHIELQIDKMMPGEDDITQIRQLKCAKLRKNSIENSQASKPDMFSVKPQKYQGTKFLGH